MFKDTQFWEIKIRLQSKIKIRGMLKPRYIDFTKQCIMATHGQITNRRSGLHVRVPIKG